MFPAPMNPIRMGMPPFQAMKGSSGQPIASIVILLWSGGPARSVFLHRVRVGALAPREHDERQSEQLDAGADQVGRRVAPRVGGPAESRLDDDASRRAEEIVGGQDRGPLLG